MRVPDGAKKLHITRRASAILWRPVTLAAKADRPFPSRISRDDFLDDDFMLPVVAEIVHVYETFNPDTNDFGERHRIFIDHDLIEVIQTTVRCAFYKKLV